MQDIKIANTRNIVKNQPNKGKDKANAYKKLMRNEDLQGVGSKRVAVENPDCSSTRPLASTTSSSSPVGNRPPELSYGFI